MTSDPINIPVPNNASNELVPSPITLDHDTEKDSNQRIWLALSGGGLRASLFHLGILLYLQREGRMSDVEGVVSVSGGSITSAHFASHWQEATEDSDGFEKVAAGLVIIAKSNIRNAAIVPWIWSRLIPIWLVWRPWMSRSKQLERVYRKHFGEITIDKLTSEFSPHFAFVATDGIKQERIAFSGNRILRFPLKSLGDAGYAHADVTTARGTRLSLAVTASSCFPPVFDRMSLSHRDLGLNYEDFKGSLNLNDGGVSGNLGLEVLLALRRKGANGPVLICDAEASLRDRPGEGLGTDILTLQTALSGSGLDNVRHALGEHVVIIQLGKRYDIVGGMDFATQTNIVTFRTDLDSPSWKEIYALVLHGSTAAAVAFGDATASATHLAGIDASIQQIVELAGGPKKTLRPTASELKNSNRRPLLGVAIHILIASSVALFLLWGAYRLISCATAEPVIPEFPLTRPDPLDPRKGCSDAPTLKQVHGSSNLVKTEDVVLLHQTTSEQRIEVAMFDWSRHYDGRRGIWRDLFPTKEITPFEAFSDDSTGWFSFYVRRPDGNYTGCLGTINLFTKRSTKLIVEEKNGTFLITFD